MDVELQAIVEAERVRIREAAHTRAARLALARRRAPIIAAELARIDSNVQEVWLFGSVVTGRPGRDRFDIDLAIRGGDVVSIGARLTEPEFAVDLIDLDTVSEGFRDMVLQRGKKIYGADR